MIRFAIALLAATPAMAQDILPFKCAYAGAITLDEYANRCAAAPDEALGAVLLAYRDHIARQDGDMIPPFETWEQETRVQVICDAEPFAGIYGGYTEAPADYRMQMMTQLLLDAPIDPNGVCP